MKIIIFGGSFDPIHNGHINIAKRALEVLNADKVIFLPAKNARWKSKKASDYDRLNMIKLAINDYPMFEVSTIELNSTRDTNYTFDTINEFEKSDNDELYFLIGYDQLNQLDKWYKIEELSKIIKFVCFSRPDYQINSKNATNYDVFVINENVSDASSTKVRELIDLDVPLKVLDYISENDLYYIPKIKTYINNKRFKHSINVAHLSYEIAISNNLDYSKAYIASILHDLGKYVDFAYQEVICKKYCENQYHLIPRALHHQFVGVEIAINDFNIKDEEILEAIKYHATGAPNMTNLGKIVYCSDKIDPGRGYDSIDMINSCKNNINSGFIYVLKENIKYFKLKNIDYKNPLTISCIEYYLGK